MENEPIDTQKLIKEAKEFMVNNCLDWCNMDFCPLRACENSNSPNSSTLNK